MANDQELRIKALAETIAGDVKALRNNKINSVTTSEPSGSNVVLNIVFITQANYDAAVTAETLISTTLYIIDDA